jgi:recombinational DNA repair protein (RecF pathway)
MYLIKRGEKPRPICFGCRKAGPAGEVIPAGEGFICKACREVAEAHRKRLYAMWKREKQQAKEAI